MNNQNSPAMIRLCKRMKLLTRVLQAMLAAGLIYVAWTALFRTDGLAAWLADALDLNVAVTITPATGLAFIIAVRSPAVMGPSCEEGGRMRVRWTMEGADFSSSVETSASPVPSSVITCSVSNAGFGRKLSAAAWTDFLSLGV